MVAVSGGRRMRRSPAQWRALVGAFEQSGITRGAFCARQGVSVSTFDWWRKRLGTASRGLPVTRVDSNALFVELSTPPVATDAAHATPAWDLELELGAGMVLRLRRGTAC
jgi:hypothetical protein